MEKFVIPVATIVTKKTIDEFELFKFSMEQYHDVDWYLSCDKESAEKYKDSEMKVFELIKSDDADHNVINAGKRDRWMAVMMTKFTVCKKALEDHEYVMFLDCDMLFVNPIENKVLNLIHNMKQMGIDAFVCQHMTNNFVNEGKHGYFNAGMFVVSNKRFLNTWEALSKNYKEYKMYFEQKPLEYIQRNFITVNLPINYDIGWWRFNETSTKPRLKQFSFEDEQLMLGNLPAVNFHMHMLKQLETANFGKFLADSVIRWLSTSDNPKYVELLEKYNELSGETE